MYLTKNVQKNYSIFERIISEEENEDGEVIKEADYEFIEEKKISEEIGVKVMVNTGWFLGELSGLGSTYFTVGLGAGLSLTEKPKPRLFFRVLPLAKKISLL